jgi:diaminohydroxyphosphoribosylaminopyrimidine deaminase / 5-amino-6-(5-phosphoribosylamino)uracil reductase
MGEDLRRSFWAPGILPGALYYFRAETHGDMKCLDSRGAEVDTGLSSQDRVFMRKAISLAGRGKGMAHPNPMVGALVVKNGNILGKGYHRGPYTAHAEVEALKQAGEDACGATMYVSLEPCNHHGRTPPCTEAIIAAGIERVVIAATDPNTGVKGGGMERLREAGLTVQSGLMGGESSRLNEAYEKYIRTGIPLVIVKMAITADGKVAARGGASRWISGEKARRRVHAMRRESDAVMVGKGTVEADDPELTVRMVPMRGAKPPLRVIVDSMLSIPLECEIAQGKEPQVMVATTHQHDRFKAGVLRDRGVEVEVIGGSGKRVDLDELLLVLGKRGVAQLLVEGGPTLVSALCERGLVDRLSLFVAPKIFGDEKARSWIEGREVFDPEEGMRMRWRKASCLGEDLLLEADMIERG